MEEATSPSGKDESPRVLKALEALKQASQELQVQSHGNTNETAIKALLQLQTEILSKDPNLTTLSQDLTHLKSLVQTLQNSKAHSFTHFLTRRASTHSISRVALSIETQIQAWIDRECVVNLVRALTESKGGCEEEEELAGLLSQFENRVAQGFNHELQDLVLKSKLFSLLENVLVDESGCRSMRVREHCAYAVAGLIKFNKDVFVGQVLFGPSVSGLLAMGTLHSVKVLCSLIRSIKSALVDEMESNGELPRIIGFLDSEDLQMRVVALDCVVEIGYFGRKEAIEAMLKEGLIGKLVELQRSELGGDLIDLGMQEEEGDKEKRQSRYLERHPFASCVARFAVQLEVGEGLRKREKRAFKQEVLVRVREACDSDAQAATIIAEVLWGASP